MTSHLRVHICWEKFAEFSEKFAEIADFSEVMAEVNQNLKRDLASA